MSIILSPKLHETSSAGTERGLVLMHWCPGCNRRHAFEVEKPNDSGALWVWDGNVTAPSFSPSMHITTRAPIPLGQELRDILLRRQRGGVVEIPYHRITLCHYFLAAGRLQFLHDSSHKLAGQTVDLPDIPEWVR